MMKVKKSSVRKAATGAVCGPGDGSCKWSKKSKGAFSEGRSKKSSERPSRGVTFRTTKKEEIADAHSAAAREPYERDFPGDSAPGGFTSTAASADISKGKKSTRWRTTEKGKIRYVGQSKAKSGIKLAKKSAVKKMVSKAKMKKK
jgi:hypothetical protein